MTSCFPHFDHQEGILPAGRARYPVTHDNSKCQAASMPASTYRYNLSHDALENAVAFGATICKYSFVWYTGDSG